MEGMMQRRSSPMIRTVMVVAVLGAVVYLIYLNHDLSTKLKNSDDRAERNRRSHESLSAQLQVMFDHKTRLEKSLLQEKLENKKAVEDLTAAKKEYEGKCVSEREGMINRLNAHSRDNKMLKSQHDDLKADYEKLQQEVDKLKSDIENQKTEDNREYQMMKQEKELEESKLKDAIANQLKELEKAHSDLRACEDQNRNIQVMKDTALSNITKLQQDITHLKAVSVSTNSTVTNLQAINKKLEAAQAQNQLLISNLQQKNRQLTIDLQNAQANQLNNAQQVGLQQQGQQNGAVVMNQGLQQGGAAVNQNPAQGGVAVVGQQNQAEGVANQPVAPDVNDQQAFQIKPANIGGEKQEGYDHGQQNGAGDSQVGAIVANEHKEEEDQQHQVLPPNLNEHRGEEGTNVSDTGNGENNNNMDSQADNQGGNQRNQSDITEEENHHNAQAVEIAGNTEDNVNADNGQDMENVDNAQVDEKADNVRGDENVDNSQKAENVGDIKADNVHGDENAEIVNGDENAEIVNGDKNAEIVNGDENAEIVNGDENENAEIVNGDENAEIVNGDENAEDDEGDINGDNAQIGGNADNVGDETGNNDGNLEEENNGGEVDPVVASEEEEEEEYEYDDNE